MKLIDFYRAGTLSFKYVKTFNMDEYVEIPRDHPESYHTYMYDKFFNHIDIDPTSVHILDGNAPDLQVECNGFEEKIKEAGGVDLFIGGGGRLVYRLSLCKEIRFLRAGHVSCSLVITL